MPTRRPAPREQRQRAAAAELDVVGVGADREHVDEIAHRGGSGARSN